MSKKRPQKHKPAMTNLQKIALITETIDKEIRPTLVQDGGDLELIDIAGNEVFIALRGQCAACSSAAYTTGNV